jgi:hypothetical protein
MTTAAALHIRRRRRIRMNGDFGNEMVLMPEGYLIGWVL